MCIRDRWKTRVPQQWRKGEIIPITKKGKPSDTPEGYRPITLTSACCKVAERMVVRRLNQFFEMNAVIDECQAGFRAVSYTHLDVYKRQGIHI